MPTRLTGPERWWTVLRFGQLGGENTGPNPTDRRSIGSKHYVLTGTRGVPLAVGLTGTNAHDVTQPIPLVQAIPPVGRKVGRPRWKPNRLYADRAYDSYLHRVWLWLNGIEPVIVRRGTPHGSGSGRVRWGVERSLS